MPSHPTKVKIKKIKRIIVDLWEYALEPLLLY